MNRLKCVKMRLDRLIFKVVGDLENRESDRDKSYTRQVYYSDVAVPTTNLNQILIATLKRLL